MSNPTSANGQRHDKQRRLIEKSRQRLALPTWVRVRRFLLTQIMIIVGCCLAGLGYALFQVPFDLAAGGVSGTAIIINHYTGASVGMLFLLLNIPLLAWGFFSLGRWIFLRDTVLAVITFSAAADFFTGWLPTMVTPWPITHDLLLSAIYAGLLYGLGMGLIYRAGSTIGGTSIPARILNRKTGFPMSQSFLFTDMAVIIAAGIVFDWEKALLAFLSLVLSGIVSDFVLEGSSQVRTAMIITRQPEVLRWGLMEELGKGVSMWDITGGYSGEQRTMIYITVRRSQVADLRYAVTRLDPDAFMVIGVVQQAWGGVGFRSLRSKQ